MQASKTRTTDDYSLGIATQNGFRNLLHDSFLIHTNSLSCVGVVDKRRITIASMDGEKRKSIYCCHPINKRIRKTYLVQEEGMDFRFGRAGFLGRIRSSGRFVQLTMTINPLTNSTFLL